MTVWNHAATFIACVSCFVAGSNWDRSNPETPNSNQGSQQCVYDFGKLESLRSNMGNSYLPFLRVSSLHCGIYALDVNAKDGQHPHSQDEVYYVESGQAKIQIAGEDYDVKKGSVVFVPAKTKHHFHSITEDLRTLVFFSKGPTAEQAGQKPGLIQKNQLNESIDRGMIFNSTMESVTDANLFDDDGWIYKADSVARKEVEIRGAPDGVKIVKGAGLSGDCLRFEKKTKEVALYKATKTVGLEPKVNWSGSISFFLKVDPNKDLGTDYCDPIQLAGRKWNDGAIWCDFDKLSPRTFRMGVFSNFSHWNPYNKKLDEIPEAELPIITVDDPPFGSDQWTHVLMTFENVNSATDEPGTAKLYLNGELKGTLKRDFKITWSKDDPLAALMLGLNYVGDFDELSVYDRALTHEEAEYLNRHYRK